MGCMQQKKSQKHALSNFLSQKNINGNSNKQIDLTVRPSSTQLDYQTTFKLNLIQDLMRNRESKVASSKSLNKKQPEFCPVQRKMKKLTISSIKTKEKKVLKVVSESADGFPQPILNRRRSQSNVNC